MKKSKKISKRYNKKRNIKKSKKKAIFRLYSKNKFVKYI